MNIENEISKKDNIRPLAFGVYFWPFVVLTLAGLTNSAYLAVSHYRVHTDIGYESFCAISRAINCDTVSESRYAVLGNLPVPVWGVIGYLFLLLFLVFARKARAGSIRMWSLLFAVTLFYSGYSVYLAIISHVHIHSYCIMCIVSYAINFMLLFYAWMIRRRFDPDSYLNSAKKDFLFIGHQWRLATAVLLPFAISGVLVWHFFPAYWHHRPIELAVKVETGRTPDGHPWIGSENADLVITEFTDYMCFQCSKIHNYLRRLLNRYPEKIKIIHRHFPMDSQVNPIVKTPFHEGAGMLALLAIQAEKEGKFWLINDELYVRARETSVIDVTAIAKSVGLDPEKLIKSLRAPSTLQKLNRDIIDGLKLGISGTPSFVIDGKVYISRIPTEIVERIWE
jgi:uncharacterized membrane protein